MVSHRLSVCPEDSPLPREQEQAGRLLLRLPLQNKTYINIHFLPSLDLVMFPFTCQEAKEPFAAHAVPHEQRVGHAHVSKLHVDALRAQPHLQVAELHDWVAVPFLQPVSELASAGRKQREALERQCAATLRRIKLFI